MNERVVIACVLCALMIWLDYLCDALSAVEYALHNYSEEGRSDDNLINIVRVMILGENTGKIKFAFIYLIIIGVPLTNIDYMAMLALATLLMMGVEDVRDMSAYVFPGYLVLLTYLICYNDMRVVWVFVGFTVFSMLTNKFLSVGLGGADVVAYSLSFVVCRNWMLLIYVVLISQVIALIGILYIAKGKLEERVVGIIGFIYVGTMSILLLAPHLL